MGLDIYFHRVKKITDEIGYFRKVNFLVGFFEEQLGKEIQNCQGYQVSKEDIEELKNRCTKVLLAYSDIKEYCDKENIPENERETITAETVAESLLPTTPGFFFGEYDYDEWYFNSVKEVLEYTDTLLSEFDTLEDDEYIEFYIWY